MAEEFRKQQIADFINSQVQILAQAGIELGEERVAKTISDYQQSTKTINEIIIEVEELVAQLISNYQAYLRSMQQATLAAQEQLAKLDIPPVPATEKTFGESLNKQLVAAFMIYESIIERAELTETEKASLFATEMANALANVNETMPGIKELNYQTIANLYQKFIADIDIVVPEWEMKMATTKANQSRGITIREGVPVYKPDGSKNLELFDFSHATVVYDFAQRHGKKLKLHTILWHQAFPDCLKQLLVGKTPPGQRNITLNFLESYLFQVASWAAARGYEFSQIDVLNEIAFDQTEGGEPQIDHPELRDSDWSRAIGDDPQTKEPYYITVLKMVRKYFPQSQLLYNEYNEYHEPKCTAICKIVDQIKKAESVSGVTLLDGIGLQSHYSEYNPAAQRATQPIDVYQTMYKLAKTGKALYRSEYDFTEKNPNNSNKPEIVNAIKETDQKCGVKGHIGWGNSDQLSWQPNQNATLVQSNGESKPDYEYFATTYSQKRKQPQIQKEQPKTLTLKPKEQPPSGFINITIIILLIVTFILLLIIGYLFI